MRLAMVNLTGGGISGGYRKYIKNITPLLLDDPRVEFLYLYLPENSGIEIASHEKLQTIFYPAIAPLQARRIIEKSLRELGPNVVFIPTTRYLNTANIPHVVQLRNMEAPTTPTGGNTFFESLKNIIRAWDTRRAIRSADRVIGVSQFVSNFIISKYGVPASKVSQVYPGVAQLSETPKQPACLNGITTFAFTVGSIRPYRKLEDAINAWALLDPGERLPLVVAGSPDPDSISYHQKMKILTEESGIKDQIIWAGQMGPKELAWCYQNCAYYLMTSRIEASPNAALEAMFYGCSIISSTADPMPEFFEDVALYYANGDAKQLAEQIRVFQAMPSDEIASYRQRSSLRAAKFTWKTSAAEILQTLELCLKENTN